MGLDRKIPDDSNKSLQRLSLALPSCLTLLVVFAAALPVQVSLFAAVAPALSVMSVYFWTLHRPELMPNSVTFGAGLLQDVLFGVPLGTFALALLIVRGVTYDSRGAILARPVWFAWLGFALISIAALAVAWALVSIVSGNLPATSAIVATVTASIALFPLLAWPLVRIKRHIGDVSRGL